MTGTLVYLMEYLTSVKKQFLYYKTLAEKAIDQIEEPLLFCQRNEDSNSIAMIVKHLAGNMLSRWTNVLSSDGEKPWRDRDSEFVNDLDSKAAVIDLWNLGWSCFFNALDTFSNKDLETIIYIRNEGLTVVEAIQRQLAHYPYHIGQMIYIAKELKQGPWKSLSIARNQSKGYNEGKFAKEKGERSFIDAELNKFDKDDQDIGKSA